MLTQAFSIRRFAPCISVPHFCAPYRAWAMSLKTFSAQCSPTTRQTGARILWCINVPERSGNKSRHRATIPTFW